MLFLTLLSAAFCRVHLKKATNFRADDWLDRLELRLGRSLGKRVVETEKINGGIFITGKAGDVSFCAYYHPSENHTVYIETGSKIFPEIPEWIQAGKWAIAYAQNEEDVKGGFQLQSDVQTEKNGGSADTVISIAAGEIGYCRWNDPETGTKYGRWYAGIVGDSSFGANGVPFCAMFVSWVLNQAGVECAGFPNAYCPYCLQGGKDAGRTVSRSSAQKGDVLVFDWSGCVENSEDHVGFVESNDPGSSTMVTIEGNTGDGEVLRKERSYTYILGVIRPYYDGSSTEGGSSTPAPSCGEGAIAVDGSVGYCTISAWQRAMGTTVDGVLSGQNTVDKEYLVAFESGVVNWGGGGSLLVQAIQKKVGASVDGYLGPNTIKGIQKFVGVDQDGYFGPATAKAVQQSINDGKW